MTEQTHGSGVVEVERGLRALAAVDREVDVPAHVHASVMRAWDARPRVVPAGERASRLRTAFVALASAAAVSAVVVSVYRGVSETPQPPAHALDAGIVLVPDPFFDVSATNVVRVRMPRRALVSLGIPVVEPDGGGSVDLEVLVGEDGIARTIRRAVPVAAYEIQE